ncbi:MAG: ABC transporter permease [Synergistaceae bacterium]|nr:ABC transporter permease [Synergistaceae bacterium]MBP9627447.1 ABC transporter permease [Synergistaceae bacterium]MBP9958151.1 ABC transporter permease [Synergistaceae bacterium]
MGRYILKRLIISLFTVWVLVTAVFFLVRAMPGDPFLSDKLTPEIREHMMRYHGFDQPLYVQYLRYLGKLIQGDLGVSMYYNGLPIRQMIAEAFPYSADLGIRALLLATAVGISLGIISALQRGRTLDYVCIIIAILGVSLPDFVTGYLLQYFFALKLKLFPVALWRGFRYTILPTVALSFYTTALLTRMMRASMLEVVGQDYIRVARAKGLSTVQILWRHQLRNAILPVVTVLGPVTAAILSGTFIIETIYAIPGMGKYYVNGIQNLDYSQILGMTIFYGTFLILANFVVDIIYGFIDPRIRVDRRDARS